jgi:predicted TIM-barrel fold metal-dependent hydrolase
MWDKLKESPSYLGFPPLPDQAEMVRALVHDPPEVRWRQVRALFRLEEEKDRQEMILRLQPYLERADDFRVKYRIFMALKALHQPLRVDDYAVVRGKGAFKTSELAASGQDLEKLAAVPLEPAACQVVDFHIHPKSPDLKFFADLKEAGVTHAVILATDTDPADVERPEIQARLKKDYACCSLAQQLPFDAILRQIKASLYSPTHVTNQDVADWVADYPDLLTGFGSVNPSKDRAYVEAKIAEVERLKLRGFKLLPFSQFFSPAENDNLHLLFESCRRTGAVILSHTGCGAGPFEILELSGNNHPSLWENLLKRYPDVPLVLAHFGAYSNHVPGIWLYEALQLGKKFDNVYADLAAVDWLLDREPVVKEIRKTIGFERVLFATDYPGPLSAGVTLASIVKSLKSNKHLTDREKCKVLGRNGLRLLGLG